MSIFDVVLGPREPDELRVEVLKGQLFVLELQPGDQPVLMFDRPLRDVEIQRLREIWLEVHPSVELLVIDSGAQLGVIRSQRGGAE